MSINNVRQYEMLDKSHGREEKTLMERMRMRVASECVRNGDKRGKENWRGVKRNVGEKD